MSASRLCIKCDEEMTTVVFHEVAIDRCPKCGGIWLDKGELEKLWDSQGQGPSDEGQFEAAIAKLAKATDAETNPKAPDVLNKACPTCAGKLAALTFGTTRIEQCGACDGLFLDSGELHKAMRLLDEGEATTLAALASSVFTAGQIG